MDSGWLLDSDGQWYYLSLEHDGHFGYLVSGWHFEWGSWYYLNESHDGTFGSLQNGWLWHCGFWYYLSEQHDGNFGGMLTGWQKIGEYWYYLYPEDGAPQGSCALDTVIDGWRVDASGRWVA
jgi:glucan-binding YG repeat protein